MLKTIHDLMDAHLAFYEHQLCQAALRKDTKDLWRTIARCIERAFADALNLNAKDRKAAAGHGKPKMTTQTVKTNVQPREAYTDPDKATQSLIDNSINCGEEANRCNKQQRRIQQIIQRLRKRANNFYGRRDAADPNLNFEFHEDDMPSVLRVHDQLNEEAIPIILEKACTNDKFETETATFFTNVTYLDTKHIPTLLRMPHKYHKKNKAESIKEMRYRTQIKKRHLYHN